MASGARDERSEPSPAALGEAGSSDESRSTIDRLVRAVELLASAHASRARAEANADFKRFVVGVVLVVMAFVVAAPIILLLDIAAAEALAAAKVVSYPIALLIMVGANATLATIFFLVGKARLRAPVLAQTRATIKQAAIVLRGSVP